AMLTFSELKKAFEIPYSMQLLPNPQEFSSIVSVASNLQGLCFCIWVALKFDTFTDEPYNLVSGILARNKWHSVYWEALELLNKKGILLTSYSVRALVSDNIKRAREMVDKMKKVNLAPNALSYTSVLYGLCQVKNVDEAQKLFNVMKEDGYSPDVVS
ncbi:pentatricopeptide repeat-containing protein, partial [Trifolium medium]|nr:pentatricopeptide repeat-containing protein [Trifolium medium]